MGRDFTVDVFHGFFLVKADVDRFDQEENGFFDFLTSLDDQNHEMRAMMTSDDTVKGGKYRYALFPRASNKTMYVNESNEVHRVSDLTTGKLDPGWDEMLERFCKEQGLSFQKPEWWLCTEGQ